MLSDCALAACNPTPPRVLDDAASYVADASSDAAADASPATAPCTFEMPVSGFSSPLTGQCTASWVAMDAGCQTSLIHHAFTISGIAADIPWTISDVGILDDELFADYTIDVQVGAQVWHLTGPLASAAGLPPGRYWASDGGVVLHLTARQFKGFAYDHFYAEDVHGSFDMDQPVELHARF